MPALLACLASVLWGSSDFLGGLSARRLPAQFVTAIAVVAGLGASLLLFAVVGGDPTREDLLLGAASGALNCVGLIALYRALALGPMSVAAPVTSVTGAGTAVVAGLLGGERFTGLTALGAVAAVIAIVAV
ncbi:MAG: EamA family transporter, partial [Actinomycetota bacterium]